ncbi:MAG: hypothetical protein U1E39_00730 [Planctomycetota bacterium]
MAGIYVPLVLLPRYTTLCGATSTSFTTIAMDVSDYEKAVVSFWRAAGMNLTSLAITFEESMDQQNWSTCGGGPFTDPGSLTEGQFSPVLTKRWFRINLTLTTGASAAIVTCWCIGFLMQRES